MEYIFVCLNHRIIFMITIYIMQMFYNPSQPINENYREYFVWHID